MGTKNSEALPSADVSSGNPGLCDQHLFDLISTASGPTVIIRELSVGR
jgi:hypothetical protein